MPSSEAKEELINLSNLHEKPVETDIDGFRVRKYLDSNQLILKRFNGKWKCAVPLINETITYKGTSFISIEEFIPLQVDVPKSLTSHDELAISWDEIKQSHPSAVDAISSPNENMLVVVTSKNLLVFKLPRSDLQNPDLTIEIDEDEHIVSNQWSVNHYVSKWEKSFQDTASGSFFEFKNISFGLGNLYSNKVIHKSIKEIEYYSPYSKAIFNYGDVANLEYPKDQTGHINKDEESTAKESTNNNNMKSYIYITDRIVTGDVVMIPEGTNIINSLISFSSKEVVTETDKDVLNKLESTLNRKVIKAVRYGTSKDYMIHGTEYETINGEKLYTISVIHDNKLIYEEYRFEASSNFEWPGDEMMRYSIVFLANTSEGIVLGYTYLGFESANIVVLKEENNRFVKFASNKRYIGAW